MDNLWTEEMFNETLKMLFPSGYFKDDELAKKATNFFLDSTYKNMNDNVNIKTLRLFINYCGLTKYNVDKKSN